MEREGSGSAAKGGSFSVRCQENPREKKPAFRVKECVVTASVPAGAGPAFWVASGPRLDIASAAGAGRVLPGPPGLAAPLDAIRIIRLHAFLAPLFLIYHRPLPRSKHSQALNRSKKLTLGTKKYKVSDKECRCIN